MKLQEVSLHTYVISVLRLIQLLCPKLVALRCFALFWYHELFKSWIFFNRKTKMINLIWLWKELIFDKNDDNAISTAITRITLIQFCWKLKSKCNQSFPKIHTLLLWFFTDGRFSTLPIHLAVRTVYLSKKGLSAKVGKHIYGLTQ